MIGAEIFSDTLDIGSQLTHAVGFQHLPHVCSPVNQALQQPLHIRTGNEGRYLKMPILLALESALSTNLFPVMKTP